MNRFALISGGLFAALAVALGAFGTHALGRWVVPDRLDTWSTAARYLMTHGQGLILIGLVSAVVKQPLKAPTYLLFTGTSVFCGSLFLLVLLNSPWLGAVAPVGGLLMIAGWLTLTLALVRNVNH